MQAESSVVADMGSNNHGNVAGVFGEKVTIANKVYDICKVSAYTCL